MDKYSGQKFRDARIALRLTLEEASVGICTPGFLSLIERDIRQPSPKMFDRLSERLRLSQIGPSTDYPLEMEARLAIKLGKLVGIEDVISQIQNNGLRNRLRAEVFEDEGAFERAIQCARAALSESQLKRDLAYETSIVLLRSLKALGRFGEAINAGEERLSGKPPTEFADSLELELRATLAGVYLTVGDTARAQALLPDLSATPNASNWDLAMIMWAKANAYQSTGEFEKAVECSAIGLEALRLEDRPLAEASLTLVDAYLKIKTGTFDYDMVKSQVLKAAEKFREMKNIGRVALSYSTLALLELSFDNSEIAQDYARKAISTCPVGNPDVKATVLTTAAGVFFETGSQEECEAALLAGLEILNEHGARAGEASAWHLMAEILEAKGDYLAALTCLKAVRELTQFEPLVSQRNSKLAFSY